MKGDAEGGDERNAIGRHGTARGFKKFHRVTATRNTYPRPVSQKNTWAENRGGLGQDGLSSQRKRLHASLSNRGAICVHLYQIYARQSQKESGGRMFTTSKRVGDELT